MLEGRGGTSTAAIAAAASVALVSANGMAAGEGRPIIQMMTRNM
jgi:ribonuclease PH